MRFIMNRRIYFKSSNGVFTSVDTPREYTIVFSPDGKKATIGRVTLSLHSRLENGCSRWENEKDHFLFVMGDEAFFDWDDGKLPELPEGSVVCPACNGTGAYNTTATCFRCNGKGYQTLSDIERNMVYDNTHFK